MARAYIVDGTATQVAGPSQKVSIMINTALTGTIKVIDGESGTTANVATITNPSAGQRYVYGRFNTGVRIIASGACDITVDTDGSYGSRL